MPLADQMRVRAIILDVYRTLLWLGEIRVPTAAAWHRIWSEAAASPPPLNFEEYMQAWDNAVFSEHQRAHALGIDFPEVHGPSLVRSFLPESDRFSMASLERVLRGIAREVRDCRLSDGAAEFLREMRARRILLGIASNSQPYTLDEFGEALVREGLGLELFEPDLIFWSHCHGVAKPSPFVFRTLGARLAARGISPRAALMVGDRIDRDIEPAAAQGWQTYQIDPADHATGWRGLAKRLSAC